MAVRKPTAGGQVMAVRKPTVGGQVMAVRKPTAGTMIVQHPDNAKAHRVWQPRTYTATS